jgi:hypothetical protein
MCILIQIMILRFLGIDLEMITIEIVEADRITTRFS